MFNPRLMTDADIIKHWGGPTKLAALLGYRQPQRVSNWIRRGIPAQVKLDRPDLFIRPFERRGRDGT